MTSMGTSRQEYRYNILNRQVALEKRKLICLFEACPTGSYAMDVQTEIYNALVVAKNQAEEDLKTDPTAFIPVTKAIRAKINGCLPE